MNRPIFFAALLSTAITAGAHVPGTEITGFLNGFAHSLFGADHLLAALAVGCLAGWGADGARWVLPLTFVGSMTIGMGANGAFEGSMTEMLIAMSVIMLGLLIARGKSVGSVPLTVLVGVFAWFHGQAHGASLWSDVDAFGFAVGVIASTSALHATGFLAAARLTEDRARATLRVGGIGMALTGVLWAL